MARRLDSLPSRNRLYPWGRWTDGSAWRIKRGVDYEVSSTSMAQIVRQYGRQRGLAVTALVNKEMDAVEFQFSQEQAA